MSDTSVFSQEVLDEAKAVVDTMRPSMAARVLVELSHMGVDVPFPHEVDDDPIKGLKQVVDTNPAEVFEATLSLLLASLLDADEDLDLPPAE